MPTPSGHTTAIRARKVIGTAVHDQDGKKIGTVEDIVLDKMSNNILFAIVSFGGALGLGEKYHPVPWAELDFDEKIGGYCVRFTEEELKAAPADDIEDLTREDAALRYRDQAYAHYGTERYWQ